ncbi:hypothetical protein [Desulfoluna sp.]|uniref:hypothetical protein n=1 Tax=Desulfoluna sp. TaxID=2045199 RepID=UPI0026059429|nr:hypothetical protein [Desulfoluna sp.]
MYFMIVVVQREETADEIITGLMDLGVTMSAVVEATDALEIISHHVPLFAGFRLMAGGGITRSRAILSIVEHEALLTRLKKFIGRTISGTREERGFYVVTPMVEGGPLSNLI